MPSCLKKAASINLHVYMCALACTDTQEYANAIARSVTVNYQNVKKPILTIQDAIAAQSFFPSPGPPIVQGNAKGYVHKHVHVHVQMYMYLHSITIIMYMHV